VRKAIEDGKPVLGTFIIPSVVLARDGEEISRRASIHILDTPGASPGGPAWLSDGMVVGCAAPFPASEEAGGPSAILLGGILLTRRYEIVDTIKETLFQKQFHAGKEIGSSTIFQGDVRISTNVLNADGSRAVGSRLSEEVAGNVLRKGDVWAHRAFVVNDWYIAAYEPIRDLDRRVIGALYVGILEKPFQRPLDVIVVFFLVMLGVTVLAVLATLFLATKLTLGPIGAIVAMCHKVMGGDLTARVGIRPSGELGVLCRDLDRMAESLAERERLLHERTQRQIGQSEKLASIGRLAAGIAHEINNPLTGVLTFTHLLKSKPNLVDEDRHDLDIVIRETTRVREIVRGLLDFARQSPPAKAPLQLNDVIRLTMKLLRSQKEFSKVKIEEKLDDRIPLVLGDRNQLQQVFLNLSLNACEAMPDGGILTIRSSASDGSVQVVFQDTGTGIKPEHIDKIFDPFFTTKPVGKGTGLGLSVSYGTIEGHGGSIEVESVEGHGAAFTVTLPAHDGGPGAAEAGEGTGSEAGRDAAGAERKT